MRLTRMFSIVEASAHCDLPCGVYDPAQARIEAESCLRIAETYAKEFYGRRGESEALWVVPRDAIVPEGVTVAGNVTSDTAPLLPTGRS